VCAVARPTRDAALTAAGRNVEKPLEQALQVGVVCVCVCVCVCACVCLYVCACVYTCLWGGREYSVISDKEVMRENLTKG